MTGAVGDRKLLLAGAILTVVIALVAILLFFSYIYHDVLEPQHTREELLIAISPEGPGTYSVWLPVIKGSPLADPGRLTSSGATVQLVQYPNGPYLNITGIGDGDIHGAVDFSGSLNDSYLDYEWAGGWNLYDPKVDVRAYASGNVTVTLRFDAESNYCFRHDTLNVTIPGNGAWTAFELTRYAECS